LTLFSVDDTLPPVRQTERLTEASVTFVMEAFFMARARLAASDSPYINRKVKTNAKPIVADMT